MKNRLYFSPLGGLHGEYHAGREDLCISSEEMLPKHLRLIMLRVAVIDLG